MVKVDTRAADGRGDHDHRYRARPYALGNGRVANRRGDPIHDHPPIVGLRLRGDRAALAGRAGPAPGAA
jgi:hypothetical protein